MLDITRGKVYQKEENRDNKESTSNKQADINKATDATTTGRTKDEQTTLSNNYTILNNNYNNSAAIDNINVIYDNDTTILELSPNDNYGGLSLNSLIFGKQHKSPSKIGEFINSDRTEEVERENYATCLIEPFGNIKHINSQAGQLNFWQAINDRGPLHILVRIRHKEYENSKLNTTNDLRHPVHPIEKRESFRAPVEHIPTGITDGSRLNRKIYQIWMANECKTVRNDRQLLVEVSPTFETPQQTDGHKVVDFDAELTINHFNLTGKNSILNKHLIIELPDQLNRREIAREFACCKVNQVNSFPVNELDNFASISIVQPVREDLLAATELPLSTTTTTSIIVPTEKDPHIKDSFGSYI